MAKALTSEDASAIAAIEAPREADMATGTTEEAKEAAPVVTGIGETSAVIGINLRKLWFDRLIFGLIFGRQFTSNDSYLSPMKAQRSSKTAQIKRIEFKSFTYQFIGLRPHYFIICTRTIDVYLTRINTTWYFDIT